MAKRKAMPSQEVLKELLEYDPETGIILWKWRPRSYFQTDRAMAIWNGRFPGKPGLCSLAHNGYLYGAIFGDNFSAHRIAWRYIYGINPIEIDHINGDRADNRLANLREVTRKMNCRNQSILDRNTSGHPGIYWDKVNRKWHVRIGSKHLGRFASFDEAVAVRTAAEAKRKYHPNHGRKGT